MESKYFSVFLLLEFLKLAVKMFHWEISKIDSKRMQMPE